MPLGISGNANDAVPDELVVKSTGKGLPKAPSSMKVTPLIKMPKSK